MNEALHKVCIIGCGIIGAAAGTRFACVAELPAYEDRDVARG